MTIDLLKEHKASTINGTNYTGNVTNNSGEYSFIVSNILENKNLF